MKEKKLTPEQTQKYDDLVKSREEITEEVESQIQIKNEADESIVQANKDKPDITAYLTSVWGYGRDRLYSRALTIAEAELTHMMKLTRGQLKDYVEGWSEKENYKKYMKESLRIRKNRSGYDNLKIAISLMNEFKTLNIKKYDDIIAKSEANKIQADNRIYELGQKNRIH